MRSSMSPGSPKNVSFAPEESDALTPAQIGAQGPPSPLELHFYSPRSRVASSLLGEGGWSGGSAIPWQLEQARSTQNANQHADSATLPPAPLAIPAAWGVWLRAYAALHTPQECHSR